MKDCSCPDCGATLQIITDGQVGEEWAAGYYVVGTKREMRMVRKPFGACMRCDFCIVIDTRS